MESGHSQPASRTQTDICTQYNFLETWYTRSPNDNFLNTNTQFNQMEKFSFIFDVTMPVTMTMTMVSVCASDVNGNSRFFSKKAMATQRHHRWQKESALPKSGVFNQFIHNLCVWMWTSEQMSHGVYHYMYIFALHCLFQFIVEHYFASTSKFNKLVHCSCFVERVKWVKWWMPLRIWLNWSPSFWSRNYDVVRAVNAAVNIFFFCDRECSNWQKNRDFDGKKSGELDFLCAMFPVGTKPAVCYS